MSNLPLPHNYIQNLDSIKQHFESKDLYAYTIRDNELVEVPLGWLGRLVTWIGNKIGIRTNEQLVAEFALDQLKNINSYVTIAKPTLSLLNSADSLLLNRIKTIAENTLFCNKELRNEISEQVAEIKSKFPDYTETFDTSAPEQFLETPSDLPAAVKEEFYEPSEFIIAEPSQTEADEFVDTEDSEVFDTLLKDATPTPPSSQPTPSETDSVASSPEDEQSGQSTPPSSLPLPWDFDIPKEIKSGEEAFATLQALLVVFFNYNADVADSFLKLLGRNVKTFEYDQEKQEITLTYSTPISGKFGEINIKGLEKLSGGSLKISPTLKFKIDSSTKTFTVVEGSSIKGTTTWWISASIKFIQVTPDNNFTVKMGIFTNTMTLADFNTVFTKLIFD